MPKLSDVMAPTGAAAFKPMKLSQVQAQAPQPQAPQAPKDSLFRMDSDFRDKAPGVGIGDMTWAAAKDMFGSRQGAAEYLAKEAGGKVVPGDNGDPLIELPDGTRYRTNDPGLDSTDVGNVAGNVAVMATPAGWVSKAAQAKNVGMVGRVGAQAATMGAADTALQATFDNGRIDPVRTLAATAGGGAGEALSPIIGRGVNAAVRMVRGGGDKAAAAQQLADALGTPKLSPQQQTQLASGIDEIIAGADPATVLGRKEFGFIYTQGQQMLDPARKFRQLSQEEYLRQQPGAAIPFLNQATNNEQALQRAITDTTGRMGAAPGATPGELSNVVQGRVAAQADELKGRINKAYQTAGQSERAAVSADSVRQAPQRVRQALGDFDITSELTPATERTVRQMTNAANAMPDGTKAVTLRSLETQRRIINNNIAAAANPTDRRAMTILKREYDNWMDDAFENALVSGDEAALKAMKEARGLRAEFGRRFEGDAQADKFVADLIDGGRTPEEMLNVALGAGQVSKSSGGRFITRLRAAVNDDPETINALRAAQFLRMTTDATGKPLGPQAITNNIMRMEFGNRSAMDALYTPVEWLQVKRLAAALKPLVPTGDFAKSSGTAERLARMLASQSGPIGQTPIVGGIISGLENVRTGLQANRVLTAPLRAPLRPVPTAAAGAATLKETNR